MWGMRSDIGLKMGEGIFAELGQSAPCSVKKARDVEFIGDKLSELVASSYSIGKLGTGQGDKGHNINNAKARMHTVMVIDIQCGNCALSDIARRSGTHSCNHAAVVVWIRMNIEKVGTSQHCDCSHNLKGATLADVHHALQHIYCLAHPACQNH